MERFIHTKIKWTRLWFIALCLISSGLVSPLKTYADPPAAPTISSPLTGTTFPLGDYITFTGTCTDPDDGNLTGAALNWVSSKDGPIGTGQNFSINTLQAGDHTITLTGTDSESLSVSTSISITVGNTAPTSTITQPSNNSSYSAGSAITFSGTGTDADGDSLTYAWTAYIGGFATSLGSQSVISYSSLPVGTHVIILTVDDGTDSKDSDPITVTITNNPPTATILSPTNGASYYPGDTIFFNGQGSDPEGGALTYLWSFAEGGLADQNTASFSNSLPAGTHTVTFTVTDSEGDTNTTPQTITITVGNNAPTATISSPLDGTSYNMGQSILFTGTATDTEDGSLTGASLVWTSDLEGTTIGTGTTFSLTNLQSGTHLITLTATDLYASDPKEGTDTVVITVNNTFPTASITAPTDGSTFYPAANITFSGLANDAEDGALSGTSVVWSSSLQGPIGTGSPLTVGTLIEGEHIITMTATDSSGASTDSATITITVGNALPTVTITAPSDGSSYSQGETITFRGTAQDDEDGALTGASLTWSSNTDGPIGTGTILPIGTLSTGTHTITLTATDSQGESVFETIAVTVVNSAPVITINTPPDGSIYDTGTALTLSATVLDNEDGVITGTDLSWSSSLDGALGTGTSLSNVVLSKGSHVITLTATDSEGKNAMASITVHIGNEPPTATIIAPLTGTNYEEGEYITFTGEGDDDEDGTLTGTALEWVSNVSGTFAYGDNPSPINTLAKGLHVITLIATDSNGAITYSATVNIRVGNNDPVATILNPADYAVFEAGETINFEGTGLDDEDGVLLGNDLVWTSSREGVIGTGTSLSLTTLSSGQHTITLTATDLDGATGAASITLKAQNALPVVTLLSPATGREINEGEDILFQGSASDYEDGALTGTSLVWSSNLDGDLGTGTNLTVNTLSSGTHTITLTATDNDGSSAQTSISLEIVPMKLTPTSLSVSVGEEGTIAIEGGKSPYRVATRRAQIALPSEDNGVLTILGVSKGSTVITVTDNNKKYEEVSVTVTEATGGSSGTDNPPEAYAGPDQIQVSESSTVTLSGSNLNDPTGTSTSFLWVQIDPNNTSKALSPPTVSLSNVTSPTPSFTVPIAGISGSTLWFQLTTTTAQGSDSDQVSVTIADNGINDFGTGVITFKTSTAKNMGITMVGSGDVTMLNILDPDDLGSSQLPQTMIYGLITMDVTVDYAGAMAVMTVYLPSAAPAAASWFKYMPDEDRWVDFDRTKISNGSGDGAVFSTDRKSVTLYITDDGPYDDNSEDGKIQDPSGLGFAPLEDQAEPTDDDGGCFVRASKP